MGNYNTTDVVDMEAELKSFSIQIPSTLIDPSIFIDYDPFV